MPKAISLVKEKSLEIRSKSASVAELIIYGTIGESPWEEGVSAKQVSEELKKLDPTVKEIQVRINSFGGSVFDGITIYNRLKQHPAKITVYIDGLAASIASIIALAGDKIIMGEGALYMIHLPWTWATGNRGELENTINRLLDVEEQMISIYSKKTGKGRTEIKQMLESETWMDSAQALEEGFIDETMIETVPIAASAIKNARWINKIPKMKTQEDVARENIKNLKDKISGFIARK